MPQPIELSGLWRRSLIRWPDGRSDATTWVRWMQTPSVFVDLRQPANRPDFSQVRCLRDLDREEVRWMASQEGFAGDTLFDGVLCEWRRQIDFQPVSACADAGRLWFEGMILVEEGRDIPYIEHWHRDQEAPRPCAGLALRDDTTGQLGMIVRTGDEFMYARARPGSLPPARTLSELLADVPALRDAQDLVDCEISFGDIGPDGWRIRHSSLPFKEGLEFEFRGGVSAGGMRNADIAPDGSARERCWQITRIEGGVVALMSPPHPHAGAVDGRRSGTKRV